MTDYWLRAAACYHPAQVVTYFSASFHQAPTCTSEAIFSIPQKNISVGTDLSAVITWAGLELIVAKLHAVLYLCTCILYLARVSEC